MKKRSLTVQRIVVWSASMLALKVTAEVVFGYRNYFPLNFQADFLIGRQEAFRGIYWWAFYTHIVSGPISLVLGLMLMSKQLRTWKPQWHRHLGRVQVPCTIFLVAPSGMIMAFNAAAGPFAVVSFVVLAAMTGLTAAFGWRAAMRRDFAAHGQWMSRCFALLLSAVVLRIIGGAGEAFAVESPWYDPVASWACWLIPLGVCELRWRLLQRSRLT